MLKNEMMIQGELSRRVSSIGERYSLDEGQCKILSDLIYAYHKGTHDGSKSTATDEEYDQVKSAIGFPNMNLNIYIRGFAIDVFAVALIKLVFTKGVMGLEEFVLMIKSHISVIENEDACVFKKIFQHESYATEFKVEDVETWFFTHCNNEHKYWKCTYIDDGLCPNKCTFDKGKIRESLEKLTSKNVLKYSSKDGTYRLRW